MLKTIHTQRLICVQCALGHLREWASTLLRPWQLLVRTDIPSKKSPILPCRTINNPQILKVPQQHQHVYKTSCTLADVTVVE
jgi:hypothetical protein